MLQYILTGLAGIAIGIVAMRVWQMRDAAPAESEIGEQPSAPEGEGAAKMPNRMLLAAGALVVVAVAVFALRSPDDGEGAGPSGISVGMAGAPGSAAQDLADVDTMIDRLAKRLENEPGNGEGFRMLGWSYVMTGHPDKAIEPYKRALKLLPDSALVHSGYGEALAGIAKNTVTPEAKAAFEKAVAIDPGEQRAQYFLGLWQAQNGQEKQALDKWVALANSGPASAPWQVDLRKQIAATSKKLGVDVSSKLKEATPPDVAAGMPTLDSSTVQAASQMPAGDRQQMIDGMVEGLAEKLKTNPGDAEGWVKLLRSRMVLKQTEKARDDLIVARKALADDVQGLRRVDAAAAEFKVPGA